MSPSPPGPGPIIAVVGLAREASMAMAPGVRAIVGGGGSKRLAVNLERAAVEGARAIISFGIAGGLDPALPPGAVVIGTCVRHGGQRWATDEAWAARLKISIEGAVLCDIAGSDHPLAHVGAKRSLREASNAAAVDMESHVAAPIAAAHGLPFAVLRIVCDPAERSLPPAALAAMREDGTADISAVLSSLMRSPGQFPDLLRLSRDARLAFGELRRCRVTLGPAFALP